MSEPSSTAYSRARTAGGLAARRLGLDGVRVTGLVMDPVDPSVLYAGTSESVYKTSTGGE